MNGVSELAKLFKERENSDGYTPMFGTVIDLPDTKIRINEKVILNDTHIRSCIPLKATDENSVYINLNKEVVLLSYSDNQKFIVIGVAQ